MYTINKNYVHRIINNKLIVLNLNIPDEVLVFNDLAKDIFLLLLDNKDKNEMLIYFKNKYNELDNANLSNYIQDFTKQLFEKGIFIYGK